MGHFYWDNIQFNQATVPEPASLAPLGTGLLVLAGFMRRKAIALSLVSSNPLSRLAPRAVLTGGCFLGERQSGIPAGNRGLLPPIRYLTGGVGLTR
jgi:hypothetical protein